jgi:predicted DsbA family dithiol-disulfide isomerase
MSTKITVDFASDVVCPWCAVGLNALEKAIETSGLDITVTFNFLPFELNPRMPPAGENAVAHIIRKYGGNAAQIAKNQERIQALGEEVGFRFDMVKRTHFYNTFDAHRLLFWAGLEGRQHELKHALFSAYFTDGRNVSSVEVLAEVAGSVGLDPARALQVLRSGEYGGDVRELQRLCAAQGIDAVPVVTMNDMFRITGAQSVEYYRRALEKVVQDSAA